MCHAVSIIFDKDFKSIKRHEMAIGVTAKLRVQPGKNDEFEALFKQLEEAVNSNEDGCNFYALHQSREDPLLYMVLEQYADEDALAAHAKTEYYKRIGAELGSCVSAAPEVELFDSV
ncbi:MAG: quinol monooxygenase YgiN [Arenicella sp.]|jgi:quinol monooxygenase YgiN